MPALRFATLAAVVAATARLAAAEPHHGHAHAHAHAHAQLEKRQEADVTVVTVYELNGVIIPAAQVEQGLQNGTFVYQDGSTAPQVTSTVVVTSWVAPASSSATPTVSSQPAVAKLISSSSAEPPSSSTAAPASSAAPVAVHSGGGGVSAPFPDGQIPCDTFPSDYGAVDLSYLGLGGWAGVQAVTVVNGAYDNIMTMVPSLCPSSGCCVEGAFCSYACPPGYQKSQWPSTQGLTGQSIGGIQCQNGMLHLTNPSLSSSLCMPGASEVNIQVQNTMSQNAAICRTDYPGTEGETIPTDSQPGTTLPLTCPDASNYYTWGGKPTSAQYYANPAGVSVEDGCQWGNPGQPWGNYAPANLGVGYSAGAAWLSIFQNSPTTNAKLDYSIEIVGDNGGFDNLIGKCKYFASTGEYCSGPNYEICSGSIGCTVNVQSGTATFVLS